MTSTNPLLSKVKLPGRVFQLPSLGAFYQNGELDPAVKDGELHIHPMTALTEINLKNPDFTSINLWNPGIHIWTPGFDFKNKKNRKKIINPLDNMYICNEAISIRQTWIESSLLTANELLDYF